MNAADVHAEAAREGASALRYRIERLRGITNKDDDALVREMIDKWTRAADVLESWSVAMGGSSDVRV